MVKVGLQGSWLSLVVGELCLSVVASFYFNAFHECIHNTAFRSRWLNTVLGHVLGFLTLRGKAWYMLFHWAHHRYTNDPAKDPELSGSTADRTDFTASDSWSKEVLQYAQFLSGYPFGFERLSSIVRHAIAKPPEDEFWVVNEKQRAVVRREYQVWLVLYGLILGAIVYYQEAVLVPLTFYWLLPHILGAAHLRYYQAAEHRGCQQGPSSDTTAWLCSRTTATWWFYCQLAWNMPYHSEHHAWPNVPFHQLPDVHKSLAAFRPKSGCVPAGEHGYFWLHASLVKRIGTHTA